MNITIYANALRKHSQNWKRMYDSSAGGARVVEYSLELPCSRILVLQLWDWPKDSKPHRVSHSIEGSMNTLPTYFNTVDEMLLAIQVESLRCDNKKFISK